MSYGIRTVNRYRHEVIDTETGTVQFTSSMVPDCRQWIIDHRPDVAGTGRLTVIGGPGRAIQAQSNGR